MGITKAQDSQYNLTTKERLIYNARDLFLSQGYHNTSISQIAQAARLTPSGIYKHYQGKEDLLRALVEPSIQLVKEQMKHAREDIFASVDTKGVPTDFIEFFKEMPSLKKTFLFFEQDRSFWIFILTGLYDTPFEGLLETLIQEKVEGSLDFIDYVFNKDAKVPKLDPKELSLIVQTHVNAYLQLLKQDLPLADKLANYTRIHNVYFIWWYSLFNKELHEELISPSFHKGLLSRYQQE